MKISIDFETYSECDIFKAGAYAYADHHSTKVLCLAYAVDDGEPKLWTPDTRFLGDFMLAEVMHAVASSERERERER